MCAQKRARGWFSRRHIGWAVRAWLLNLFVAVSYPVAAFTLTALNCASLLETLTVQHLGDGRSTRVIFAALTFSRAHHVIF